MTNRGGRGTNDEDARRRLRVRMPGSVTRDAVAAPVGDTPGMDSPVSSVERRLRFANEHDRWRALLIVLVVACGCVDRSGDLGVRNAHGLAFDGRQIVLFGGADAAQVRGDTWGWDGCAWHLLASQGPDPRTFPLMVSDGHDRIYLYGGRRVLFGHSLEPSQLLRDLWQWNGRRWARLSDDGPSARAEAAGAWDPVRRRLLVFGGYTIRNGVVQAMGDTWEFGEGRWVHHEVSGPAARHGATAAFDPVSQEVVLFGGNGAMSDTWLWNGARWRRGNGESPGRYNAASTTVHPGGPVLRFGGWTGAERSADSWEWRGAAWTPAEGAAPPARNHAALAFDWNRGRAVLVGGHDGSRVFGDVWERANEQWVRVFEGAATERVRNDH